MDSYIVIKLTSNENNIIKSALENYEEYLSNIIKNSSNMNAIVLYQNFLDLTKDIKSKII